jgi:hypothetical protein
MPYRAPKISNFCMRLDWGIINNFINCSNIQFATELELKILEQVQYLNLC